MPDPIRAIFGPLLPPFLLALCLLSSPGPAAAATEVIVAAAKIAHFDDRIEALGTLKANESVQISSSITETVGAVYFDDGDRVAAGKLLVEMTSDEEHAQLEEARATVDEARRQYERVQSLEKMGTAAASLLDERRRDWDTAKARLGAIESRLADRLIKAPFGGVLGLRNVSVGALVEPEDLITTLDDDSVMKLEFPIPSIHLGGLHAGLAVSATSAAFGEREFRGEVRAVDSRIDPVTRSILIRARLPNPDLGAQTRTADARRIARQPARQHRHPGRGADRPWRQTVRVRRRSGAREPRRTARGAPRRPDARRRRDRRRPQGRRAGHHPGYDQGQTRRPRIDPGGGRRHENRA